MTKREFMQAYVLAARRGDGVSDQTIPRASHLFDEIERRCAERFPGETVEEFKQRTEADK